MRLGKRGQGLAFYGMEVMISLFIIVLIYAVLNETIKETIIPAGASASANATAYNQSMQGIEAGWDAFPWIAMVSGFLFLIMVAFMQGR